MKLYGGIYFDEGGVQSSLRNMHLQTSIMGIINDNIGGFNKVGYQRKVPVVSSFSEYIGTHGLSKNVDEEVGRIKISKNPLDLALGTRGYFQVSSQNGVQLTRDGRFKLDKDGNLLTLQNYKVLSKDGVPLKFKTMPKELEDIKIEKDGTIKYIDKENLELKTAGIVSVVTSEGIIMDEPDVKQGYVEESNVALHEELFNMVPIRRNFEANRHLFILQSDSLSKTIQELGRAT